ncbi:MAG: hypothetical protein ACREXU_13355, partial [Gammaproteobacteria bacterium]
RLVGLLLLNTLVAIAIGLLVANLLEPGAVADLRSPEAAVEVRPKADPLAIFSITCRGACSVRSRTTARCSG